MIDIDLDSKATQEVFGQLVGITRQAVASHVESGTLSADGSYRDWVWSYANRLRNEASGRRPTESRERKDVAVARQAEARAQLDEMELYRQHNLVLDVGTVEKAMRDWISIGRVEFNQAFESVISAIESKNAVVCDRDELQPILDSALKTLGDFRLS